jgi:hypothetical protein
MLLSALDVIASAMGGALFANSFLPPRFKATT